MKNKMLKFNFQFLFFLFLIFFLGSLFFPLISLAGTYQADGHTVTYEGLVPCGKCLQIDPSAVANDLTMQHCTNNTPGSWFIRYVPCQLCHLFVMVKDITDFVLVYIIFPIASLLLITAGAMFFIYAENPQNVEKAKTWMTSVIIGLTIIFASWIIINSFFLLIGVAGWTGLEGGWFEINCPISL